MALKLTPGTYQKVSTGYRSAIYQIKGLEMPFLTQKTLFRFDKFLYLGETLNLDSCSEFWRNFGEILHVWWGGGGVIRVV